MRQGLFFMHGHIFQRGKAVCKLFCNDFHSPGNLLSGNLAIG
jgi:hypothetical protein